MTNIKMSKWDAADHLKTGKDVVLYLEACLEKSDPVLLAAALGDVARAHGMAQLARETGLTCEGLYKALSADGNPCLATIMKVMAALGVRLRAEMTPVHPI